MNNPEEVGLTMIDNIIMRLSDWSDERADYIKQAFNKIIDNAISGVSKALHVSYKNMSVSGWIRKNRAK